MNMRNSKAKRIGGIVLRKFRERQKNLYHPLDLHLLRHAVSAHGHLHPARLVFIHWNSGIRRRDKHRTPSLTKH